MGRARGSRRRAVRAGALLAALALALAAGACGDDDDASSDTTAAPDGGDSGAASGGTLTVSSFDFDDVSVAAGDTLEVVNSSGGAHTVTADDGAFDEELPDGETIEVPVPDEPGEYPFHCEIHPSMTATLTVE